VDLAPIIAEWLDAPPGSANQIRVVGNLPYNISSPILFALLELAARTHGVRDAMLMLQKEVADRLVAKVGTGEYGVLTVLTAVNADVTRVLSLPPGAFRPSPKVHSAVVRLAFRPPKVAIADQELFVRMVRTMFTQRRKTIANALKPFGLERGVEPVRALSDAGIDARRRPETLELAEMAALAGAFSRP
jgi:16S rRNA (adenine1518-N6/adenine1519-N6)-dimethyltransferase